MKALNKYMPNIDRIEFAVTYACTSKCKHCSVGNPQSAAHIDTKAAVNMVKEIAEHFTVSSLMTFGGEPLLYPETVCEIHKAAAECGIVKRQLITNGCFTKDENKAAVTAGKLIESGVNDILLSVDSFHSEYLPLKQQYNFAKALCDRAFRHLRLHPAWVVNREHQNEYNAATEKSLDYFNDLAIPVSNGNNILPAGNAKIYLAEYYEKPDIAMDFLCGLAPYTTKLDEVKTISVNPEGEVIVCHFPIGNIYRKNILDIITDYDPFKNPIMLALLNQGIAGICKLAEEKGIKVDPSDYYSPCDLCRMVTKKMAQPV
jgi:MoaA/NifB/PqqE/SkfB family radical SAM enzyme